MGLFRLAGETLPLSRRQRRNAKHKASSLLSNLETNVTEDDTILAVNEPTSPIQPKPAAEQGKSIFEIISPKTPLLNQGTASLTQSELIQHQDHVIRSLTLENMPMSSLRREESRLFLGTCSYEHIAKGYKEDHALALLWKEKQKASRPVATASDVEREHTRPGINGIHVVEQSSKTMEASGETSGPPSSVAVSRISSSILNPQTDSFIPAQRSSSNLWQAPRKPKPCSRPLKRDRACHPSIPSQGLAPILPDEVPEPYDSFNLSEAFYPAAATFLDNLGTQQAFHDHIADFASPSQSIDCPRPTTKRAKKPKKKNSKPQPANTLSRKELDKLYRHLPPVERAGMIYEHREEQKRALPEQKMELLRQYREYIAQLEKEKIGIRGEQHRGQGDTPNVQKMGLFRQDRRRIAQLEKEQTAIREEQRISHGDAPEKAQKHTGTAEVAISTSQPSTIQPKEVQQTLLRRGPRRNALPKELGGARSHKSEAVQAQSCSACPQAESYAGHWPNVDKEVQRLLPRHGRKRISQAKREQAVLEKEQLMESQHPAVAPQSCAASKDQRKWTKEEKQLAKEERKFMAQFGIEKFGDQNAKRIASTHMPNLLSLVPPQVFNTSISNRIILEHSEPLLQRVSEAKERNIAAECLQRWEAIQIGEGGKFYPSRVPSLAVEQLRVSSGMGSNLAPYYPRPPVTSALEQLRVSSGIESMNLEDHAVQPIWSRLGTNTMKAVDEGIRNDWGHLTSKQRQALEMKWPRMPRR